MLELSPAAEWILVVVADAAAEVSEPVLAVVVADVDHDALIVVVALDAPEVVVCTCR